MSGECVGRKCLRAKYYMYAWVRHHAQIFCIMISCIMISVQNPLATSYKNTSAIKDDHKQGVMNVKKLVKEEGTMPLASASNSGTAVISMRGASIQIIKTMLTLSIL